MFATILLAAVLCSMSVADARRPKTPSTGLAKIALASAPPDFEFSSGPRVTRLSAFAGRPVVLNFWASWCGPCNDELSAFAHLQKYGDDVVMIAVSDESEDLTNAYLSSRGVKALSVADPDRRIFGMYGVTPIPVTLILGRDGKLEHVSVGELDWTELQAAVDAASASLPVPTPSSS